MKHYGDDIVIHTQRGQSQSSIVMSSSITLGDAVRACASLKEVFRFSEMELGVSSEVSYGSSDRENTS